MRHQSHLSSEVWVMMYSPPTPAHVPASSYSYLVLYIPLGTLYCYSVHLHDYQSQVRVSLVLFLDCRRVQHASSCLGNRPGTSSASGHGCCDPARDAEKCSADES